MKNTAAKINRPTRTAAVAQAGVCELVVITSPCSSLWASTVAQPTLTFALVRHLRPNGLWFRCEQPPPQRSGRRDAPQAERFAESSGCARGLQDAIPRLIVSCNN